MLPPKQLLILLLIFICNSCSNPNKYSYAIKDFRKELQPYLTAIVTKGVVMSRESALQHMATDEELLRLGRSEHPLLRAAAFREMLERKSIDDFEILMTHLDDTALVPTDAGEFGIRDRMISDDILQEARWKTQEAKNTTIQQVLTKHNYLRSAYIILLQIEPQEKYYSFIKDMATRPRFLDFDGDELRFDDIEYALYGLARFRKKDDVQIIKNKLMENIWRLGDVSFRLMKEYPDTAYLDVFNAYYRRRFYNFSGFHNSRPEDFIKSLAVQQNEAGTKLFDSILQRLPSQTCMPDKELIEEELVMEIWEHPCPAYARLREKIKTKAERILKGQISFTVDQNESLDSIVGGIRW